jgi:hypothetical protein
MTESRHFRVRPSPHTPEVPHAAIVGYSERLLVHEKGDQ